MASSLLLVGRDEAPGAREPYTGVLEARPSIRGGTQECGQRRTISRKRSTRWEPRAFPQHPYSASSSLAFSSLTYKGATLYDAHLERADFTAAHLEGADLRSASLDKATVLNDATLTGVLLDQTTFDNTNLSVVDWRAVPRLGDELRARKAKDEAGKRKDRRTRRDEYRAAVRANRRLAVALQANGLSEDASRDNYRAQLLQRASMLYEGRIAQWLGSWILAGLAGYGYRPARTILLYVGVLCAFAALYLNFGMVDGHAFNLTEAAVFSVTSFHGRGFFPGGLKLDDPVTVLAAVEAVIGLLIEISFIATFTQRFFNSR